MSDAIKNVFISVKAAPLLLYITYLLNSNLPTVTKSLLHQLKCGTFMLFTYLIRYPFQTDSPYQYYLVTLKATTIFVNLIVTITN